MNQLSTWEHYAYLCLVSLVLILAWTGVIVIARWLIGGVTCT